MTLKNIFTLGYEINLLPFNSSECAMGNLNIFKVRLNQVKTILDNIGFGELYEDLEIIIFK